MESDRPEDNEVPATAVRDVGEAPVASVASEAPQAPLRPGWKRSLSVFAACFVVYLAVLEGFLAVPQFNDIVQIRPASALGPVLGLFFGCRAFSVARRPTWPRISCTKAPRRSCWRATS